MTILTIIYILVFIIFALVAYAVLQIKLFGMNVKDFWSFIEANQMLDKLYKFANQYENMSSQEQKQKQKKYLMLLTKFQMNYGKKSMKNIEKYYLSIKILGC